MNEVGHTELVGTILKGMRRRLTRSHQRVFLDELSELEGEPLGADSDDIILDRAMDLLVVTLMSSDPDEDIASAASSKNFKRLLPLLEDRMDGLVADSFERDLKAGSMMWDPRSHPRTLLKLAIDACAAHNAGDAGKLADILADALARHVDPLVALRRILFSGGSHG